MKAEPTLSRVHARRLLPSDAGKIARLERRTYSRGQRAGKRSTAKALSRAERSDENLSVGVFNKGRLLGFIVAVMAPDRKALFEKFEVAPPEDADLSGQSVYVEDMILDPRLGRYAFFLFEKWLHEVQRIAAGLPVDAFCVPEMLARWKKYKRGFRYRGYELASTVAVADLSADMTWYWVCWQPLGDGAFVPPDSDGEVGTLVKNDGMPVGCQLRQLQTERQWRSLGASWNALLKQTDDADAFSSFAVLAEWWRQFGVGHSLSILVLYRDGRLAGIAPLMISVRRQLFRYRRQLSFVGDELLTERPGFLVGAGDSRAEELLWQGVLAIRAQWDVALFIEQALHCPDDAWLARLSDESLRVSRDIAKKAPYIRNGCGGWSDYLALRGRRTRKTIRRKLRRLEAAGKVSLVTRRGKDCERALDDYLALEHKSWKGSSADGLCNKRRHVRYYRRLLGAQDDDIQWRFTFMRLDAEYIAATFGVLCNGRYSSLEICHDSSRDRLSPGVALTALELQRLLQDEQCREYDFLSGALDNKMEWATAVRVTRDVHLLPAGVHGSLTRWWLFAARPKLKTALKRIGLFGVAQRLVSRHGARADDPAA